MTSPETDRPPRRRDPQDKEDRIKRAALEIFAEEGYAHSSIHNICRRAGVSVGIFYQYFDGKADLLAQQAMTERAMYLTADDLSDLERLRSAVADFLSGDRGRLWRAWRDAVLKERSLRRQADDLVRDVRISLAAAVTEARARVGLKTTQAEALELAWQIAALMREGMRDSWGKPAEIDLVIARALSTLVFRP